jgi:hypothetical protein
MRDQNDCKFLFGLEIFRFLSAPGRHESFATPTTSLFHNRRRLVGIEAEREKVEDL